MANYKKTTKKAPVKIQPVKIEELSPEIQEQVEKVQETKEPVVIQMVEQQPKEEDEMINPLRNEKVIVRLIKRQRGFIEDPKSPLYGGLADTSKVTLCVPMLRNGTYKNILTNDEMAFLEHIMGLEKGAMSIYKRVNNYWSTSTKGTINKVVLTKRDMILDLNNVDDYIRYKILLANDDKICPSLSHLEEFPKSTYMFVLVNQSQEAAAVGKKANLKFECYNLYGKYMGDTDMLQTIIKLFTGKYISPDTKIEHMQQIVTGFIEEDPKRFLNVASDKLLKPKCLLFQAVKKGIVSNKNGLYYLIETGEKLCEEYEEPRLSNAAAYLAKPLNMDLKTEIEQKILNS